MQKYNLTDADLSPIYRDLYRRVFGRPGIQNIRERMFKHLREASIGNVTYQKQRYSQNIEISVDVTIGNKSQSVGFKADGDNPTTYLDDAHLLDACELLDVFFNDVGRTGKPIRPHGLVNENTVRYGAAPRDRNAFAPWVSSKLFNCNEYRKIKDRVQRDIARSVLGDLSNQEEFVQFSEKTSMDAIVNHLKTYSHLPPEVLHRAIDMMYVEVTMDG